MSTPTPSSPAPISRISPLSHEQLLAHAGWVRALARALVTDGSLADDVEQQSWESALERPPPHDGDLRGWWYTVVRNVARRLGRDAATRRRNEQRLPPREPAESSADAVARAQLHQRLVAATIALADPYRTAILLRFFDELPPRVIAARLALPVETVRTQVKRGLEQLRVALAASQRDAVDWRPALTCFAWPSSSAGATAGAATVAATAAMTHSSALLGAFTLSAPTKVVAALLMLTATALTSWKLWTSTPAANEIALRPAPLATAATSNPMPSEPPPEPVRVAASPPAVAVEPTRESLPPPASAWLIAIDGIVRDQRGNAVADATVLALAELGPVEELCAKLHRLDLAADDELIATNTTRVTSDAEGRFELRGLDGRRDWLAAAIHPSFGCCSPREARVIGPADHTTMELVIGTPIRLHGTVHDTAGAPLPAAKVTVMFGIENGVESGWYSVTAPLDPAGRYEIELPPGGWLTGNATCPRFKRAPFELTYDPLDCDRRVDFTLEPASGSHLEGTLVDTSGAPAHVAATIAARLAVDELDALAPDGLAIVTSQWPTTTSPQVLTAKQIQEIGTLDLANDRFTIDVDDGDGGSGQLWLVARRTVIGWVERDEKRSDLPTPLQIVVDPTLLPSSRELGEIRVHVIDAATGEALLEPNLVASVWDVLAQAQASFTATTRANSRPRIEAGSVVFRDLPSSGRYRVGASATGFVADNALVTLSPTNPRAEVTIQLATGDAVVHGTIHAPEGVQPDCRWLGWRPTNPATTAGDRWQVRAPSNATRRVASRYAIFHEVDCSSWRMSTAAHPRGSRSTPAERRSTSRSPSCAVGESGCERNPTCRSRRQSKRSRRCRSSTTPGTSSRTGCIPGPIGRWIAAAPGPICCPAIITRHSWSPTTTPAPPTSPSPTNRTRSR